MRENGIKLYILGGHRVKSVKGFNINEKKEKKVVEFFYEKCEVITKI